MTVPLAVKLTLPDGRERMITRELADLSFSSKMRGGFATASAPIARAANLPAIPELSRLTVYDTQTGKIVWEGRLLTPGRSVSSRGQQADLTAIGEGIAATKDYDGPYVIVDSDLSAWEQQSTNNSRLSVRTASPPNSTDPGLTFEGNGHVNTGDFAIAWFWNLHLAGQKLGAIAFDWISGQGGGFHRLDLRLGSSPHAASTVIATGTWTTALTSVLFQANPSTYPDGAVPKFYWRTTDFGEVNEDGDTFWSSIKSAYVYARLLGRDRLPLPTARYTAAPWLKIQDVFTDVIARFCPTLDIAGADIDPGFFTYTQLSWPSGITPGQALDDALDLEPTMTWAVWERQPNGRYRTELKHMPSQVRYEATAADGWDSPAPSSDVYDRVAVRWKNAAGEPQVTWVTGSPPSLAAAGLSRTATLDMGSEVGTLSQATQRGQAFLADHRVPPSAGRLTVARPIWDRIDRRYVMPWEILPGFLVRINGVHSAPDALNAVSPDGVTVSRIVETSFRASTAAAELDLDAPVLTEQRLLAQLANARSRR